MRILVVEDDAGLAARLKEQLEASGFAVDRADNGVDGEYLGMEEPYDAVVLDLGLPRRPGLEVLRNWRGAGKGDQQVVQHLFLLLPTVRCSPCLERSHSMTRGPATKQITSAVITAPPLRKVR